MVFLWIFLPVTLALYALLTRMGGLKAGNLLLLLMSVIFYSFGDAMLIY